MERGEATKVLDDFGIEAVANAIIDGRTLTGIARDLGMARSTLLAWIAADRERTQRAIDARRLSAAAFDEMAEEALLAAKDQTEVARARELASHYRWRASKADPANFAERIGIGGAGLPLIEPADTPERRLDIARRLAFALELGSRAADELRRRRAAPVLQLVHQPPKDGRHDVDL